MKLIQTALAVVLIGFVSASPGQPVMEIIALKHRTAEQVLPTLRPLLEAGGTLTGQYNQLIVRASPRNIAELRQVLEAIDRPLRRLQISIRFDDSFDRANRAIEASGRIGGSDARVDVRAQDARSSAQERVDQRVQVLEGGHAFIATGQSRPLPQRQIIQTPGGVVVQDSVVVQDIVTGFEVVPNVSGQYVTLDIAPQRQSPGALPGSVQGQRAATTLRSRLGEWVEIGGAAGDSAREDRGIASFNRSNAFESRRIWLKVEEIGN